MKLIFIIAIAFIIGFAFANIPNEDLLEEEFKGLEYLPNFLPYNITGKKYCPTEDIWRWKKAVRSGYAVQESLLACATEGNCDNYAERNRWNGRTNRISVYVTVLCNTSTTCPMTQATVNAQIDQINKDFAGTGFTFVLNQTSFRVDATYAEIAAYSSTSNTWYTQITNLKNLYAQTPTRYLNIFITRQRSGSSGTLLGIGTFPWDTAATRNTGGLWLNAVYVGAGQKTAAHEIGHCVGLWHTFHGDSEVSCSSQCYETVHQDFGDTTVSNTVGDFCADTPAQPMNYQCSYPTGRDCKGLTYTAIPSSQQPTLLNNIMAYTPDTCMQKFTPQQAWRAQCWVCAKLSGWGVSC